MLKFSLIYNIYIKNKPKAHFSCQSLPENRIFDFDSKNNIIFELRNHKLSSNQNWKTEIRSKIGIKVTQPYNRNLPTPLSTVAARLSGVGSCQLNVLVNAALYVFSYLNVYEYCCSWFISLYCFQKNLADGFGGITRLTMSDIGHHANPTSEQNSLTLHLKTILPKFNF